MTQDDDREWPMTTRELMSASDRQYAAAVGAEHPERAWILSDRDVWYPNPYYRGPEVPHPEDACLTDDLGLDPVDWEALTGASPDALPADTPVQALVNGVWIPLGEVQP